MQKCIDQCSGKVAVSWVSNHSRRLVDNEQMIVFVGYFQRDILRKDVVNRLIAEKNLDLLVGPNAIRFLGNRIIDADKARIN